MEYVEVHLNCTCTSNTFYSKHLIHRYCYSSESKPVLASLHNRFRAWSTARKGITTPSIHFSHDAYKRLWKWFLGSLEMKHLHPSCEIRIQAWPTVLRAQRWPAACISTTICTQHSGRDFSALQRWSPSFLAWKVESKHNAPCHACTCSPASRYIHTGCSSPLCIQKYVSTYFE